MCAVLSKPKRLSPRASLCFQSCSASSRHQPSCAELLNYVFGITRRARLKGEWGQTPQALGQILPRRYVPVSTGKVLLCVQTKDLGYVGFKVPMCFSASVTGLGLFWWKREQGRLCPQTFLNPPWVLFSGKSQRRFQRSPALCCVISQRHRDTESPVVRDTSEAPRVWCIDEVTASTNRWTRLPEAEEQQTSHWHCPHGARFGDTFGNLHECWTH